MTDSEGQPIAKLSGAGNAEINAGQKQRLCFVSLGSNKAKTLQSAFRKKGVTIDAFNISQFSELEPETLSHYQGIICIYPACEGLEESDSNYANLIGKIKNLREVGCHKTCFMMSLELNDTKFTNAKKDTAMIYDIGYRYIGESTPRRLELEAEKIIKNIEILGKTPD